MYSGLRLLAVHAHPDDESSKGAATTALYTSLGARVLIATMTGGEAGDILNPALADSPAAERDIAELRRREMANAASILGAEHQWVGFVDSGLPEGDFKPKCRMAASIGFLRTWLHAPWSTSFVDLSHMSSPRMTNLVATHTRTTSTRTP